MHLYAISRVSDLLILDILKRQQKYSGNINVVTFNSDVSAKLAQAGINSQVVMPLPSGISWHKKYLGDGSPIQGDIDGMPLWKILGIDRLNFWFDARTVEILSALQFESLTVSLDIYDVFTWQIANIAKERGIPVRAIQTHSVREREVVDLIPILPVDEYIVSYDADNLTGAMTVVNTGKNRVRVARLSEAPLDETAVAFDKRDEYQFRRFLSSGLLKPPFSVFTADQRSDELYYRYLHRHIGVPVYDSFDLLRPRKEVVMFRFSEDTVYRFVPENIPVKIYDFSGINLAKLLVKESDKNVTVNE